MTEATIISALPREVTGKANRRLAAEGLIPAVLYGPGLDTVILALVRRDFELFRQRHTGSPGLVEIRIEGVSTPVNAMIKQIQVSPVTGRIMHVDFLSIRMDRPVQTTVTLHLVGEAPGVKEGGVILHEVREINVEALPLDLPDYLEVDISLLEIGESMTIADILAPPGVVLLDSPEGVICSVTTPKSETAEDETAAAITEPEVIGAADTDSKGA